MFCLFDFEAGRAVEVLLLTSKKRICGCCVGPLMQYMAPQRESCGFPGLCGGWWCECVGCEPC